MTSDEGLRAVRVAAGLLAAVRNDEPGVETMIGEIDDPEHVLVAMSALAGWLVAAVAEQTGTTRAEVVEGIAARAALLTADDMPDPPS